MISRNSIITRCFWLCLIACSHVRKTFSCIPTPPKLLGQGGALCIYFPWQILDTAFTTTSSFVVASLLVRRVELRCPQRQLFRAIGFLSPSPLNWKAAFKSRIHQLSFMLDSIC